MGTTTRWESGDGERFLFEYGADGFLAKCLAVLMLVDEGWEVFTTGLRSGPFATEAEAVACAERICLAGSTIGTVRP